MTNDSSLRKFSWCLLAPAIIIMIIVAVYPIIYATYLSFFNSNLAHLNESSFIGFENYYTIFRDAYWWKAVETTVIITIVSVIGEFVLGLAIALVMRGTLALSGVVRTVVLIPYALVTVVSAYSWLYAWTPGTGYLAHLLPAGYAPLSHRYSSLAVICLSEIWKTTPFVSLLLLSGMSLIPEEILTAAKLDGASPWQRLRRIILPMIVPAISVAVLFRTLDAFRIFDNIYVLTGGNNQTYSVSILGYDNLFQIFDIGLGSAISIVIFLFVAVLAVIIIKCFSISSPVIGKGESR